MNIRWLVTEIQFAKGSIVSPAELIRAAASKVWIST